MPQLERRHQNLIRNQTRQHRESAEMGRESTRAMHAYIFLYTCGDNPAMEMNQSGATVRALRPTKIADIKDFVLALEGCQDEIRKHEEITGAAMLNEAATKKAIASTARMSR